MKLRPCLLLLCLLASAAGADELVFAVSTGGSLPMVDFRDGVLVGGLFKDVTEALARELHATPRYVPMPRKRVEAALADGQADLLCDMRPEWLDGKQWRWSDTVFTNKQIIASLADAPVPPSLQSYAGERMGTILGYRYPEMTAALGNRFIRDDAASDNFNLDKLIRRRFKYIVTNALYFDYQRSRHDSRDQLASATFKINDFDSYCALPAHGKLTLAQLNHAIGELRKRGELQALADRYRPKYPLPTSR